MLCHVGGIKLFSFAIFVERGSLDFSFGETVLFDWETGKPVFWGFEAIFWERSSERASEGRVPDLPDRKPGDSHHAGEVRAREGPSRLPQKPVDARGHLCGLAVLWVFLLGIALQRKQ